VQAIGSYFLFRMVFQKEPAELAAIKLYVLADPTADRADPAGNTPLPAACAKASAGYGFTGLNSVYEPIRDGELQYWCELSPSRRDRTMSGSRLRLALALRRWGWHSPPTRRRPGTPDLRRRHHARRRPRPADQPRWRSTRPFAALLQDADYTHRQPRMPDRHDRAKPLESKIFSFRAHPRVLPVLAGRFDALAVANNHSGDYGQAAFLETLDLLAGQGIATFGGGRNLTEAHRPLWIERRGLRIAVLAYNEFKPRSFEAGAEWPGIAWSEDSQVVADIRARARPAPTW
jgi:hypothetical protein